MHLNLHHLLTTALLSAMSSVLTTSALALPDDAKQPIEYDAKSCDYSLSEGLTICRGTPQNPVKLYQGSLQITGLEMRFVSKNDVLESVTATGNPAQFQQQPAADQAIVNASALTITFDNKSQLLTLDQQAEVSQAGYQTQADHIEYNIEKRSYSATSTNSEDSVHTKIPVQQDAR
jgi:lipopolysaccharide export system protein LptA